MPCALEVIDTRLQTTSHIQCNRSFDQNIGRRFSKGHLIQKPAAVCPENSDTSSATLPPGHSSDWKQAPFLSDNTQEVNKVIPSSGDIGTECLELLSAQPRILCCLGQPNERNMHDQVDSSKPVSNGNTHGGSTIRQSRHRKNVCNSSTAVPPCHVVAKYSRPVATTLSVRSDSDILHNDDRLSKKSARKRGKQCKRTTRKRLNLASETTFEESTYGASPVEVVPTNLLADKLSETTPSASSLVKNDGQYNKDYVECGIMLNLATLGTDEMDGSGCAGSSYNVTGGRLSSSCAPYLNDESNMIDSSEFDGSTFTEHGLGEESNSYEKVTCAYIYNSSHATTDSIFSRWNNDNSENYSVNVESTIKDENGHDHSKPGASTRLSNMRAECQLIGSHISATHAEDTNDPLGIRSYSKDVTDSCSHTERVQCSSQACSSKASLQFSSGRRNIKSSKTPSYIDLTASNRVKGSIRHKNNGRDSSAVWQKVERNEKISKAGHLSNSPINDKGAHEDGKKGVQEDSTRIRAKHNQNRKVCKQEFLNGTIELEPTKEDALNSCHTFPGPVYKKQAPFLRQQRSSSKQGSQSLKNYYAPRNGIPKAPKDYLHQEELPMLVLDHAKNTSDRSTSYSSSADGVCLTGVGSNYPTEGNEGSQTGIEIAASVSCNLVPDLAPQAASDDSHISDSHSLCPENKGVSTSRGSKNLCTDPCGAETKEARCVKLLTENNSQECCKWYSAAGHLSQKWVPVGKKETCNGINLDGSVNGEDSNLTSERTYKLNPSEHVDLKFQADNATETDYSKMKEAISYVYTAQQQVEDIQLRIGRPIADLESFIYSASPIVHSPCPAGCKSYLQECVKDGLCLHQTPDITLRTVWQWYEEPSCYGLDVKAQDRNSHCQLTTYFVPYLSAVQLFGQPKRTSGGSIDKESINRDVTCETSPDLPPIFAKLFPKQSNPVNKSSTLHTEDDQQPADGELIFEFFESEQPYSRQQLFDKVNELIAGVKPSKCQISGDPKNLEVSLHDLHPASWYCVAWYPIYRIPDGKFQAAFLTYHSLGHWIHQSSSADRAAVLPVIGLQSYNAKVERWFEMSKSGSEGAQSAESSEASQILKERLRTLNESAAVMSRASVLKNGQMSRNKHPDFEFFLSRS